MPFHALALLAGIEMLLPKPEQFKLGHYPNRSPPEVYLRYTPTQGGLGVRRLRGDAARAGRAQLSSPAGYSRSPDYRDKCALQIKGLFAFRTKRWIDDSANGLQPAATSGVEKHHESETRCTKGVGGSRPPRSSRRK